MTPVPPNTSLRIKVHYGGSTARSSTMLFHALTGSTIAAFAADVASVCTAMGAFFFGGDEFFTAEFADPGSNLFFPVSTWTPIGGGSGTPGANDPYARYIQFGGRGDDGHRVKYYLLNANRAIPTSPRLTTSEDTRVSAVYDAILAATTLGNISGHPVAWYAYANMGMNDLITRRTR